MATATMSQINARIDSQLKTEGDKALAKAGFTPTQAIRKLWELAAHHASEPEVLVSVLEPEQSAQADDACAEHKRQVERALDAGEVLMRTAYAKAGIAWPTKPDTRSFDKLKEDAYREAYTGEMGWDA